MPKKHSYYYIDEKLEHNSFGIKKFIFGFICLGFILVVGYILALMSSPVALANKPENLQSEITKLKESNQNYLVIEKINLAVPLAKDKSSLSSKNGAWQQNSEQGNPEIGGNFIICAYNFKLGITPALTKEESVFYNLNKLEPNDVIEVFYNNISYKYKVESKQDAPLDEEKLTLKSNTAKLTILTKSQSSKLGGGVAVVALPIAESSKQNSTTDSSQNILF